MTVILRHNDSLELNHVEYEGSITPAELAALADYQATDPSWLSYDCINWIKPGADFRTVDLADLDDIFQKYRALFEPLNFVIFRRSAWICESDASEGHLQNWIGERDTRRGMSSDVRRFDTLAQACAWLVLNPAQALTVARAEGFKEVVRFTEPPSLARALGRVPGR